MSRSGRQRRFQHLGSGLSRLIACVVVGLLLLGCDEAATPGRASPGVEAAIGQIFPDPAMAAFFDEEAARAHVGDLLLIHGNGPYGETEWNTGTRRSVIRIFVDRPGARSPTNLAHEISHAAVYRQGCYNHGERWLAYHLDIARRFEARFPGVPWSGQSPTANVAAKALRYPHDHC